jgi:hypothetical protein
MMISLQSCNKDNNGFDNHHANRQYLSLTAAVRVYNFGMMVTTEVVYFRREYLRV